MSAGPRGDRERPRRDRASGSYPSSNSRTIIRPMIRLAAIAWQVNGVATLSPTPDNSERPESSTSVGLRDSHVEGASRGRDVQAAG